MRLQEKRINRRDFGDRGEDYHCVAYSDTRNASPELVLHAAALDDAVNILRRSPRNGDVFRETLAWLLGEAEATPTFSFLYICEAFDLDIKTTRAKLLEIASGPRGTVMSPRLIGRRMPRSQKPVVVLSHRKKVVRAA